MAYYQHTQTGEVREIAPEIIAGWQAANNPKLAFWTEVPAPQPPQPSPAEAIEAAYRATIYAGYCVTPEGYCIAMDEPDITRWSNYLVELRELEAMGQINAETPISFIDHIGTPRTAPLARFRQIVLGAGAAWKTAFFTRAQSLAALQNP